MAVRRTASLSLAYVLAIHIFFSCTESKTRITGTSAVMTLQKHPLSRGADRVRVVHQHLVPPRRRAQGKPGASRTRSLACGCREAHEPKSPQVQPDRPGPPCAKVLTVSFVFSLVTGLFVTIACKTVISPA